MSEEQPTFTVRDRRLFNPDGSPREVEREETPAATETASTMRDVAPSQANSPQAGATPTSTSQGARRSGVESSQAAGSARSPLPQDRTPEDAYAEDDLPGADDPASFINFLMSIASNAAAALGMMEHPATGQRKVDLQLGKHWIDVLGMLQQKTRGNLTAQEQQIFEGLLADLRMQYVSLTKAAPPTPPRGFTGRDIIGGK